MECSEEIFRPRSRYRRIQLRLCLSVQPPILIRRQCHILIIKKSNNEKRVILPGNASYVPRICLLQRQFYGTPSADGDWRRQLLQYGAGLENVLLQPVRLPKLQQLHSRCRNRQPGNDRRCGSKEHHDFDQRQFDNGEFRMGLGEITHNQSFPR